MYSFLHLYLMRAPGGDFENEILLSLLRVHERDSEGVQS